MTTAGRLDVRVQIRRAASVDDGFTKREAFVDHGAPIWASRRDVSDSERVAAAQVAATITTRFVVRWSKTAATISPRDRLTCEGREYDISGVKEMGRRAWLEITAAGRADL